MPRAWRWVCVAGVALLAFGLFRWFPPGTWHQIPFLDNWVPRYQSTIDQVALMRRGALVGWNWWFLGGYQLSSDLTQNLGVLAFPFVVSLGPQLGFHLLHVILFAAMPLLVFVDLRTSDDRESATLAAALACLLTAGYCFSAIRSGDTNSLAGVATTTLAILAMQVAQGRRSYGPPLLAVALALTGYTHLGFFAYAVAYCALHCVYYRDRRAAVLLAAALSVRARRRAPGHVGELDAAVVLQLQQRAAAPARVVPVGRLRAPVLLQRRDPVPTGTLVQRLHDARPRLSPGHDPARPAGARPRGLSRVGRARHARR